MNKKNERKIFLEQLEAKNMMASDVLGTMPLPIGPLNHIPVTDVSHTIPVLSSNPGAAKKLFLDFDGHFEANWGSYSNVATPPYAGDSNAIAEIWSRVAEDYSIFDVDVTTIDPGNENHNETAVVAIGGSYTDWYGGAAGGVAYVGSFFFFQPPIGYVFSSNLGDSPKYVAEAAAHEAGHVFGLRHQAVWNGNTLVSEYSQGDGNIAPIMGVGYYAPLTRWTNGPTSQGPNSLQDDIQTINTYSLSTRVDDYINQVTVSGPSFSKNGIITPNDTDTFQFTTSNGPLSFSLNLPVGTNLVPKLTLLDAQNNVVATGDSTLTVANGVAGSYKIVVSANDSLYGNAGQYNLVGNISDTINNTKLEVSIGEEQINDSDTIDLGTTSLNTLLEQSFNLTNLDDGVLHISNIVVPNGLTLVSARTVNLNYGDTYTLIVDMISSSPIHIDGNIQIISDDSFQPNFNIHVLGDVIQVLPKLKVSYNGSDVVNNQLVDYGQVNKGVNITKTFTITNDDAGTLVINNIIVPNDYTLVPPSTNILEYGDSVDFTVTLNSSVAGSFNGTMTINTNDINLNVVLNGQIVSPAISVSNNGNSLVNNGTLDLGKINWLTNATQVFTITNSGTSPLLIQNPTVTGNLVITNQVTSVTLGAGQSTQFTVKIDTSTIKSVSGTISIQSNDVVFTQNIVASVVTPHIAILDGGKVLTSGKSVDFGKNNITKTFSITNTGDGTLNLTSITVPAHYVLVTNPGSTSLEKNETTSFQVKLDPTVVGNFTGNILINSNDVAVPQFTIHVTGKVTKSLINTYNFDNNGPSFSKVGQWLSANGGYLGNYVTSKTAGSVATWNVTGLQNGTYDLYTTYVNNPKNTNAASYTFGSTTVNVNQTVKPGDLYENGVFWKKIGTIVVTDGTAQVSITDTKSGPLTIVDAIKFKTSTSAASKPTKVNF